MYKIKKGENAGVMKNVAYLEVSYIHDMSKKLYTYFIKLFFVLNRLSKINQAHISWYDLHQLPRQANEPIVIDLWGRITKREHERISGHRNGMTSMVIF